MTARDMDHAVIDVAHDQCGVFSHEQAIARGATQGMIDRRLSARQWIEVGPLVYAFPGHPPTFRQRLWVALLAHGPAAVVTHQSAAWVHRLTGFRTGEVVITVPHPGHRRSPVARVHQTTAHLEVVTVAGLRVTSIPWTLVMLAKVLSRARMDLALDDAITAKQVRLEEVRTAYFELLAPGRRGMRLMGELLAKRSTGEAPPASVLERRILAVLHKAGIRPVTQFRLPWREDAEERSDAAMLDCQVIIEFDSRRWHTRVKDFAVDRRRDREAARRGWAVLRYTWDDLADPEEIVASATETRLSRLTDTESVRASLESA